MPRDPRAGKGSDQDIGTVGEASNRLSREGPDLAARIPDIGRIVGSRDVLAHSHDVVDEEIVWDAITIDLPELTTRIEATPARGVVAAAT